MSNSTGPWPKYSTPPDIISVEEKLKKMKLTTEQLNDLYMGVIESEMLAAETKEERIAWADLKVRRKSRVSMKRLEEAFIEDFQLWLQGRSVYNVKERTWDKFISTPFGLNRHVETKKHTPWGNKKLTHLPGVDKLLEGPATNRDHVIKVLTKLKMTAPRNIDEAWIYYKYIVRGVGIDGNVVNEQNIFSDYDYLTHQFMKEEDPTDPDNLELEPDERYTELATDNPAPPLYDNSLYQKARKSAMDDALRGDANTAKTLQFDMLGPEDKVFTLIFLRSKMGPMQRRGAAFLAGGVLNVNPAGIPGAVAANNAHIPPVAQNNQQGGQGQQPQQRPNPGGIEGIIQELREINNKNTEMFQKMEEVKNAFVTGAAQARTQTRNSHVALGNILNNISNATEARLAENFTELITHINANFGEMRDIFSPVGNAHVSLRTMAPDLLQAANIPGGGGRRAPAFFSPPPGGGGPGNPPPGNPPPALPPNPPSNPPPRPPGQNAALADQAINLINGNPPAAAAPPTVDVIPQLQQPPRGAPPEPPDKPLEVRLQEMGINIPEFAKAVNAPGLPRERPDYNRQYGLDVLKAILKNTGDLTPLVDIGTEVRHAPYRKYANHLIGRTLMDVADVSLEDITQKLKREFPNDEAIQTMTWNPDEKNQNRDAVYREHLKKLIEYKDPINEEGRTFVDDIVANTGVHVANTLAFMGTPLGKDLVDFYEAKGYRSEGEHRMFLDIMKDFAAITYLREDEDDAGGTKVKKYYKHAVNNHRDNVTNLYRMLNDSWSSESFGTIIGSNRESERNMRYIQLYKSINTMAHMALRDPRPTKREIEYTQAGMPINPTGKRPETGEDYDTGYTAKENYKIENLHARYARFMFYQNMQVGAANAKRQVSEATDDIRNTINLSDELSEALRDITTSADIHNSQMKDFYSNLTIPAPIDADAQKNLQHINLIRSMYQTHKRIVRLKIGSRKENDLLDALIRDNTAYQEFALEGDDIKKIINEVNAAIPRGFRRFVEQSEQQRLFNPSRARLALEQAAWNQANPPPPDPNAPPPALDPNAQPPPQQPPAVDPNAQPPAVDPNASPPQQPPAVDPNAQPPAVDPNAPPPAPQPAMPPVPAIDPLAVSNIMNNIKKANRKLVNDAYKLINDRFSGFIDKISEGTALEADIEGIQKLLDTVKKTKGRNATPAENKTIEVYEEIGQGMIDYIRDKKIIDQNLPEAVQISGLREIAQTMELYSDTKVISNMAKGRPDDEMVNNITERMKDKSRKDEIIREIKKQNEEYKKNSAHPKTRAEAVRRMLTITALQKELNALETKTYNQEIPELNSKLYDRMANTAYDYDAAFRKVRNTKQQFDLETEPSNKQALQEILRNEAIELEGKARALETERENIQNRINVLQTKHQETSTELFSSLPKNIASKKTNIPDLKKKIQDLTKTYGEDQNKIRDLISIRDTMFNPERTEDTIGFVQNPFIHQMFRETGNRLMNIVTKYNGNISDAHIANGMDHFHKGLITGLNGLYLDYQTFADHTDETKSIYNTLEVMRDEMFQRIQDPKKGELLKIDDPRKMTPKKLEQLRQIVQRNAMNQVAAPPQQPQPQPPPPIQQPPQPPQPAGPIYIPVPVYVHPPQVQQPPPPQPIQQPPPPQQVQQPPLEDEDMDEQPPPAGQPPAPKPPAYTGPVVELDYSKIGNTAPFDPKNKLLDITMGRIPRQVEEKIQKRARSSPLTWNEIQAKIWQKAIAGELKPSQKQISFLGEDITDVQHYAQFFPNVPFGNDIKKGYEFLLKHGSNPEIGKFMNMYVQSSDDKVTSLSSAFFDEGLVDVNRHQLIRSFVAQSNTQLEQLMVKMNPAALDPQNAKAGKEKRLFYTHNKSRAVLNTLNKKYLLYAEDKGYDNTEDMQNLYGEAQPGSKPYHRGMIPMQINDENLLSTENTINNVTGKLVKNIIAGKLLDGCKKESINYYDHNALQGNTPKIPLMRQVVELLSDGNTNYSDRSFGVALKKTEAEVHSYNSLAMAYTAAFGNIKRPREVDKTIEALSGAANLYRGDIFSPSLLPPSNSKKIDPQLKAHSDFHIFMPSMPMSRKLTEIQREYGIPESKIIREKDGISKRAQQIYEEASKSMDDQLKTVFAKKSDTKKLYSRMTVFRELFTELENTKDSIVYNQLLKVLDQTKEEETNEAIREIFRDIQEYTGQLSIYTDMGDSITRNYNLKDPQVLIDPTIPSGGKFLDLHERLRADNSEVLKDEGEDLPTTIPAKRTTAILIATAQLYSSTVSLFNVAMDKIAGKILNLYSKGSSEILQREQNFPVDKIETFTDLNKWMAEKHQKRNTKALTQKRRLPPQGEPLEETPQEQPQQLQLDTQNLQFKPASPNTPTEDTVRKEKERRIAEEQARLDKEEEELQLQIAEEERKIAEIEALASAKKQQREQEILEAAEIENEEPPQQGGLPPSPNNEPPNIDEDLNIKVRKSRRKQKQEEEEEEDRMQENEPEVGQNLADQWKQRKQKEKEEKERKRLEEEEEDRMQENEEDIGQSLAQKWKERKEREKQKKQTETKQEEEEEEQDIGQSLAEQWKNKVKGRMPSKGEIEEKKKRQEEILEAASMAPEMPQPSQQGGGPPSQTNEPPNIDEDLNLKVRKTRRRQKQEQEEEATKQLAREWEERKKKKEEAELKQRQLKAERKQKIEALILRLEEDEQNMKAKIADDFRAAARNRKRNTQQMPQQAEQVPLMEEEPPEQPPPPQQPRTFTPVLPNPSNILNESNPMELIASNMRPTIQSPPEILEEDIIPNQVVNPAAMEEEEQPPTGDQGEEEPDPALPMEDPLAFMNQPAIENDNKPEEPPQKKRRKVVVSNKNLFKKNTTYIPAPAPGKTFSVPTRSSTVLPKNIIPEEDIKRKPGPRSVSKLKKYYKNQ